MNFHVTTFGCQMNEHDSERMKGMLESLGYAEAPRREDADLILFNTCSIREKADDRFVSHLREAAALKRRDPERVIGVGGCWAQSVKDDVFRQFPFVDVAFGPGQVHKLARVPHQRLDHRPGLLRVRGLHRPPAGQARPRVPGLGADLGRLQHGLLVLHRALDARPRGLAAARRARRRGPRARRRRRARGHAAGPERQLLRAQRAAADVVRRAAGRARRDRGPRPHPLHEPAPLRHEGGRRPRARRAGERLRAHPPAAAVGLLARAQADAAHLLARALPRPRGADPRARPGLRDHHRRHRRLPGGDGGGLRADARGRRGGRLRRRLHVHLLAPARHRGGRVRRRVPPARGRRRAHGAARRGGPAARPRARAALRGADARRARSRGPRAPTRRACAAARATTRS